MKEKSMKLTLSFAELHTPLFLGGKNFGLKLDSSKFAGLELVYDRLEKELWISHNDKMAIIPLSNVVSMTPILNASVKEQGKEPKESIPKESPPSQPSASHASQPGKFKSTISAQVSTPTSHVFKDGPAPV